MNYICQFPIFISNTDLVTTLESQVSRFLRYNIFILAENTLLDHSKMSFLKYGQWSSFGVLTLVARQIYQKFEIHEYSISLISLISLTYSHLMSFFTMNVESQWRIIFLRASIGKYIAVYLPAWGGHHYLLEYIIHSRFLWWVFFQKRLTWTQSADSLSGRRELFVWHCIYSGCVSWREHQESGGTVGKGIWRTA